MQTYELVNASKRNTGFFIISSMEGVKEKCIVPFSAVPLFDIEKGCNFIGREEKKDIMIQNENGRVLRGVARNSSPPNFSISHKIAAVGNTIFGFAASISHFAANGKTTKRNVDNDFTIVFLHPSYS
jgi:hypothetical protein